MFVTARWYLSAAWIFLVLVIGLAIGSTSSGIVLLLAVAAVVPPGLMLALWKTPAITVAEVLHDAQKPS